MARFSTRPVTRANWADLETLFEARGGPSYCWCMAWRPMENRGAASNADRKRALRDRVERREPVGLLAYLDGAPVGWCSLGPRASFSRLVDDGGGGEEETVWSVTCFFVTRAQRKTGLSARLLGAAARYARQRGATVLEGYPVDADSPSYRFMGFVRLFEAQGFAPAGRAGSRRHVMRLALPPPEG